MGDAVPHHDPVIEVFMMRYSRLGLLLSKQWIMGNGGFKPGEVLLKIKLGPGFFALCCEVLTGFACYVLTG